MWRKERERFYHGKRQHPLRNFCLSLLLFVCICSAFFSGFERLSDTTRRISVGLLVYMVAIVSTPYSRQSYLPSMER